MSNDTKEDNLDLDQSSEPLQDESIETVFLALTAA